MQRLFGVRRSTDGLTGLFSLGGLVVILAALLLCVSSVGAQSTTQGAVGGTIVDPSGSAVPNAKITVTNMHTNAESSGISDDAGRFAVPQLPPGSYVVQISSQGFNNYRQENVIVEIGRTT